MTDATAGSDCKRIEVKLKAARARIRRLPSMAPGPRRQQERLLISADLSSLGARLSGVVESIMEEPSDKNFAGPSQTKNLHGLTTRLVGLVAGRNFDATQHQCNTSGEK